MPRPATTKPPVTTQPETTTAPHTVSSIDEFDEDLTGAGGEFTPETTLPQTTFPSTTLPDFIKEQIGEKPEETLEVDEIVLAIYSLQTVERAKLDRSVELLVAKQYNEAIRSVNQIQTLQLKKKMSIIESIMELTDKIQ